MEVEKKYAYAVKIKITSVDTIEHIVFGKGLCKKQERINYLAQKNHFIGFDIIKNDYVYLFLLKTDAETFYNYTNKVVKCTLLKRRIKVFAKERNTPKVSA